MKATFTFVELNAPAAPKLVCVCHLGPLTFKLHFEPLTLFTGATKVHPPFRSLGNTHLAGRDPLSQIFSPLTCSFRLSLTVLLDGAGPLLPGAPHPWLQLLLHFLFPVPSPFPMSSSAGRGVAAAAWAGRALATHPGRAGS